MDSPDQLPGDVFTAPLDPADAVHLGALAAERSLFPAFSNNPEGLPQSGQSYPGTMPPEDVIPAELVAITGQLEDKERLLEEERQRDKLTGLFNKPGLLAAANARMEEVPSDNAFAMLLIDLKDFKSVNDNLPNKHEGGDTVLRSVAEILKQSVRQGDEDILARGSRIDNSAIARLGGDEFAIFASVPGRKGSKQGPVANMGALQLRLEGIFKDYLQVNPALVALGLDISIGAVTREPNETAESMLGRADVAMYKHKAEQKLATGSYR